MQTWRRQKELWIARDQRTPRPYYPEQQQFWGAWLARFEWDWFITQTFPNPIHPEQAARVHARWTRALERYEGRQVRQVRALERQQRGVIHYHALLSGVKPDTRRLDWMDAWHAISGGYARIVKYDPQRGAAHYLAKYVTKGGEIDLLGPWLRARERVGDHVDHARRGSDDGSTERY